jgi:hypothetical protein
MQVSLAYSRFRKARCDRWRDGRKAKARLEAGFVLVRGA